MCQFRFYELAVSQQGLYNSRYLQLISISLPHFSRLQKSPLLCWLFPRLFGATLDVGDFTVFEYSLLSSYFEGREVSDGTESNSNNNDFDGQLVRPRESKLKKETADSAFNWVRVGPLWRIRVHWSRFAHVFEIYGASNRAQWKQLGPVAIVRDNEFRPL